MSSIGAATDQLTVILAHVLIRVCISLSTAYCCSISSTVVPLLHFYLSFTNATTSPFSQRETTRECLYTVIRLVDLYAPVTLTLTLTLTPRNTNLT